MPNWIGSTDDPSTPRPPIWPIRCIAWPRAMRSRNCWLGSEGIPIEDPDVLIGFFQGLGRLDGTLPFYFLDSFLPLGLKGPIVFRGHQKPMALLQTKLPIALENMIGGAQKLFNQQILHPGLLFHLPHGRM